MAIAAVALLEGIAIAANAHAMTIKGFGGLTQTTVTLAGLQLAALGGLALFSLWLSWKDIKLPKVPEIVNKLVAFVPLLAGIVILVEGVIVAYLAAPLTIRDVGSVRGFFVSAFGAELFLFGGGLVTAWLFKKRESFGLFLSLAAYLLIASAGLWVASVADRVMWTGVGGFQPGTVLIAGILAMLVPLLGMILFFLQGWRFLGRKLLGIELWSLGVIGLGVLTALGGAVVMSVAARITITNLGSFMEGTVLLGGLGLFALGVLTFAPRFVLAEPKGVLKEVGMMASLFAVLLLPFALVV